MSFKVLSLRKDIVAILEELGFKEPTEIQAKAIPLLLGAAIDFHGQAQTGTGKTLAFGLPLLQKIDRDLNEVQGLIIAPTRELAVQIYESLLPFASKIGIKLVVAYGGVSIEEQTKLLHTLFR